MPGIHLALLIGASQEQVFDAVSTQAGISGWWTPRASAEPLLHSIVTVPFSNGYEKKMEITGLKPYETVVWDCISGADEWVGTSISFQLIPGNKDEFSESYPEVSGQLEQFHFGEGTLLIFRHTGWARETLMFAECSYTWGLFLRSLKLYCETGEGKPWPDQHRSKN